MEHEEKQLKEYYENAGRGLKNMYIGVLGALICSVLVLIPGLNLLAILPLLVFSLLLLIGLFQAGKDIPKCKAAFIINIVGA